MAGMSAVDVLRELVAIPSVSFMANRPVVEAAARLLAESGWVSRLLPYQDAKGVEKMNLIARPAGQTGSEDLDLAFVCHTDTVPFDLQAWPLATTLTEHDGMLHGCGACDVKGSLAGILAGIAGAGAVSKNVALILTADEEAGCIGATRLLASESLRVKSVLVCEPTSLRPAVAGKGYGLAEVRVTGREAHSAFPQKGVSAIYAAAAMLRRIEERNPTSENPDVGHPHSLNPLFDPPWTTLNVGVIEGGSAKNIIPGACRFLVEWRPLPEEDVKAPLEWLRDLALEIEREYPSCSVVVDGLRGDAGFAYPADSAFVLALSRQLGTEATGISFGSEATRFARIADEVVVMGPGNMHTAHSDRECIPVAELEAFAECVRALLKTS
jgi:acetylornithine deacetylase